MSWSTILENKKDNRYEHTLREILQQPQCWKKTLDIVLNDKKLKEFLDNALIDQNRAIIVSGAGSSEFVGQSLLDTLSKNLNRVVTNAPTTDIVTSPLKYNIPKAPALMISFARSGNSPESVASFELIKSLSPSTKHLIITCNKDGSLANATKNDENTYLILLPEETNDVSLVMTSSFSSMLLAASLCGYFGKESEAKELLEKACHYTEIVLNEYVNKIESIIIPEHINRIQYLGTSDAKGVLTEAHLKMLEMTDGRVATRIDSFLGLRHGPQVFTDKNTLVVALLSEDPYISKYEIDLIKEMKAKNQGCAYIILGKHANEVKLENMLAIEMDGLGDFFRLFPTTAMFQLLGLFKSLSVNLSPDSPSASGTINRVVEGVNIYPFK